jgi:hypothetical protein
MSSFTQSCSILFAALTVSLFEMQAASADVPPSEPNCVVDGTQKQRLTYMNKRHGRQSDGHFRLAGSLSFVSDNGFFGDVLTKSLGLTGYIVYVRLRQECVD